MKKIASIILAAGLLSACADTKTIDGTTYDTYGIFNADDVYNDKIHYDVVWGNVFWGIVLSETIIAPIYFFGYSIKEPVGVKNPIKGARPVGSTK